MKQINDLKQIWAQWELGPVIGKGSYATVYKIIKNDHGISTSAALKIIQIPFSPSESLELENTGMDKTSIYNYYSKLIEKLTGEITIMNNLRDCPNIVSLQDFYIEELPDIPRWNIYIRMELLQNLDEYICSKGRLSTGEVVKLGIDMCQALIHCERNKTIHRDIKPSNIFINSCGVFKLGDFGISKQLENLKSAESRQGTPYYMAPEIYRGEKYNNTVDIYSLGITLYRLLNNYRLPFISSSTKLDFEANETALNKRLSGTCPLPPPSNADPELSKIILKACQFDSSDRYQTASTMLNDLIKWQMKFGTDMIDPNEKTLSIFNNNSLSETEPKEKTTENKIDNCEEQLVTIKQEAPPLDNTPVKSTRRKKRTKWFIILFLILAVIGCLSFFVFTHFYDKGYKSSYDKNGKEISRTYLTDKGKKSHVDHLDADGTILSSDYYDSDGNMIYSYKFNKNGQRILETQYKKDGSISYYTEFNYDSDDIIIGNVYRSDKTLQKVNEYNHDFFILNSTHYDKNGKMLKHIEYDTSEQKISCIYYDKKETIDHYSHYEYDSDNVLVKESVLGPDEKPLHYIQYGYTASGKLLNKTYYKNDNSKYYQLEFNSSGDILYEYYFNSDGSIDYHYEYSYNSEGIKMQTIYFNSDNIKEYINEFDTNGNKLYQYTYNANNEMTNYFAYNYDDNNILTRADHYYADGVLEYYYLLSYDDDGQELKRTYYTPDDNIMYYYKYNYNDKGQIITETKYDSSDTAIGYYEHLYDVNGQLINTNYHEGSN